mmetsp:Transcript_26373/g.61351  ORF Transcript_26373/g.61351 Transcript_26373/m.61351 type:complete len:83 (-) Transcript_26373:653-901(-)
MSEMFFNAGYFNQDISRWDVQNVRTMGLMFQGARSFNQPISSWNVGNVQHMVSSIPISHNSMFCLLRPHYHHRHKAFHVFGC